MRNAWPLLLLIVGFTACAYSKTSPSPRVPPLASAQLHPVFDPQAQVEGRPARGQATPIRVLDMQPLDRSRGEPIQLRFDRPVASRDALPPANLVVERQLRDGTWTNVEGRSRWARTDRLRFDPRTPLPSAHALRVRLEGAVGAVSGVEWRFETPRPELELLEDWSILRGSEPLLLWCDEPLSAAALREHLRVVGPSGARIPVRVARPSEAEAADYPSGTLLAVHPKTAWPRGGEVRVELRPTFRADDGVLPLGRPLAWSRRTLPPFRMRGITCADGTTGACPLGPIELGFTTEPEALDAIALRPEPDDFEAYWGDAGVVLDGDFEPGRRYTVRLPARLRDDEGQALEGPRAAVVRFTDEHAPGEASLRLSSTAGIFSRVADARVGVWARRVRTARVRIAVLDARAGARYLRPPDEGEHPWPEAGAQAEFELDIASAKGDRRKATVLDLGRWAGAGDTVLVEVEPTASVENTVADAPATRGVYRITGLGVWSHHGPARGVARVTDLATAAPRRGVTVELRDAQGVRYVGRTDDDGLVTLPGAADLHEPITLLARADDDALAMPLSPYGWTQRRRGWCRMTPQGHCRYVRAFGRRHGLAPDDDAPPTPLERGETGLVELGVGRGVYMPGDPVHVAGWAGISTPHGAYNTRRVPEGTPVELVLRTGGVEVARGTAEVNAHGRFSASLRIPKGAALGGSALEATMLGSTDRVDFEVSTARLPHFEVAAVPLEDAIERGAPLRVDVRARYLSGEPAPIERLDWVVRCTSVSPELPRLDDDFDAWTHADIPPWTRRGQLEGGETPTLALRLPTDAIDHRSARRCAVSVAGQDPSRQPVGAEASVRVHPGPGYLALSVPDRVTAGERPVLRAIVVDAEGAPRAAEVIAIELYREGGRSSARLDSARLDSARLARCEASRVRPGAEARCRAPSLSRGDHTARVTARVDGEPLELERQIHVYARPRPAPRASSRSRHEPEPRLTVVAPPEARPGTPIPVSITAPWRRGAGVLTIEQTGLRTVVPFALREGKARLSVSAREGAGEILELTARVERSDRAPARAHVATASASVFVRDREPLTVTVTTPDRVTPGAWAELTVAVEDADGEPVDARLAVWVIDDAVHQLRRPPPVALERRFNPHRPFEHVISEMYGALLDPFDPIGGWSRAKRVPRVRRAKAQVKGSLTTDVRERFEPAPLFVGDLGTGADGTVAIPVSLADDLTRFHVRVIASAELAEGTGPAVFGRAEATMRATTALPVRAALPRVLRPGDRAEIAAIVSAPEAGTLEVRVDTARGPIATVGPTTRTRRVRAGQVIRVPFSVQASRPGEDAVRFSAALRPARGGAVRGAVRRPLAVRAERTAIERAAIYGSVAVDTPVAIPVALPEARRGAVDVAITTTARGDLQDAAEYLVDYPYGCVEQTASRLIPLVAMRGWRGRGPDVDARIADAVAHLQSMQLPSGAFAYWPGAQEPSAFGTAYAVWVLRMAMDAGAMVPTDALERAEAALRVQVEAPLPEAPGARDNALVRRSLALRALAGSGPVPAAALDALWEGRARLPVFSRLLLLQTLHRVDPSDRRVEPLLMSLSSSIERRAGVAHVVDPTEERWWWMLSSPVRTEALALMTLHEVSPDDPRLEPLARGLREMRRGGRWRNTQENAFALLALSRYASRAEAQTPHQRVRAWVGAERVVDATVHGFDPVGASGEVDIQRAGAGASGDATHVVVQREGAGRAYYRVGVEWTPQVAPARAQGVAITRTLPRTIRVGDTTNIEISLEADAPVHHLAVEVPLPPGLEAVEPGLGAGAAARVRGGLYDAPALSHIERRPDRVLLFFDALPPGITRHRVPVVATTPGRYSLPAAVAEAMYEPETRGRTTRGVVRVLAGS